MPSRIGPRDRPGSPIMATRGVIGKNRREFVPITPLVVMVSVSHILTDHPISVAPPPTHTPLMHTHKSKLGATEPHSHYDGVGPIPRSSRVLSSPLLPIRLPSTLDSRGSEISQNFLRVLRLSLTEEFSSCTSLSFASHNVSMLGAQRTTGHGTSVLVPVLLVQMELSVS